MKFLLILISISGIYSLPPSRLGIDMALLDPDAPPPPGVYSPMRSYLEIQNFLWRTILSRGIQRRNPRFVNPFPSTTRHVVTSRGIVMPRSSLSLHDPTVGVCETVIMEGRILHSAQLFSTRKAVALATPIKPKEISCLRESATDGTSGECVLVGYPHGAWVVYNREEKELFTADKQVMCSPFGGTGSSTFRCWDYVMVPGACVLKRS